MLSLKFISSHGIILLRVLFHLIKTISFKCFDHILVEQTLAWINDLIFFCTFSDIIEVFQIMKIYLLAKS